jgi:hypothetical protein
MEPGNMRMAERPGEPGSTLLMHEFFEVIVKGDGRAEEAQVYQALGFAENGDVIMVKGLYYAPARVVLGYRPLRGNAHTYDAAHASSDADIQLREGAPELVLVRNCTAWFEMGALTDGKPMVVHPLEIKERRVVVAGKAQHYVCGSQAREEDTGGFSISALPIYDMATVQDAGGGFDLASTPDKRLGQMYDSVTAMWGVMGDVFANARGVLRDGNGVRSGMFQMPFSLADFRFWNQVSDTADDAWSRSTYPRQDGKAVRRSLQLPANVARLVPQGDNLQEQERFPKIANGQWHIWFGRRVAADRAVGG